MQFTAAASSTKEIDPPVPNFFLLSSFDQQETGGAPITKAESQEKGAKICLELY
jgi:hypothetical protein